MPKPLAELEFLYVDEALVVVNKPSLLLSVPGKGEDKQDCVASRVVAEYPDALIVHRLDWETSGVMVLARGKDVHRELSRQFHDRETAKEYVAVVAGLVQDDEGIVDLPMRCDIENRPRQIVDFEHGKTARTRYRVLARESDRTRVLLEPVTGRSHQLRVHMASLGHAIVGDPLYANDDVQKMADRLQLHARELGLTHPLNREWVRFGAEVPF